MSSSWRTNPPYNQFSETKTRQMNLNKENVTDSIPSNANVKPKYLATCQCSHVMYEVLDDPLDSKLCHCRDCQKLHGAPFEWVSIFEKTDVRFLSGLDQLYFWSDELGCGFEAKQRDELEAKKEKNKFNGLGNLSLYN